jgi:uncharacterized spore protein YtfJ
VNDVPTPPTVIATNAADRLTDGFARIADVSAERIFREPVRVGDRVVITAAAIDIAGGMGTGSGGSRDGDSGGGGGGGGRVEGRPVAAIEIGPDGVSVRPIIDFTRIGMTAMLGAFAVWRALKK